MLKRILVVLCVLCLTACSHYSRKKELAEKYCENGQPKEETVLLANYGYAYAQSEMGRIYHYGFCGETDVILAEQWYLKSVKQNNELAEMGLGFLYSENVYHKKHKKYNIEQAIFWLKRSANKNNHASAYQLSEIYYDDRYGVKDDELGDYWYEKAKKLEKSFNEN